MRSGESCSSSSSSDSSSKGPKYNHNDAEDEIHAWKRKKPSVTRKSTKQSIKVVSAVAKRPRKGKFSKNTTVNHPPSSVASPPDQVKQVEDNMHEASNDEPSGRKSFMQFVIENYRKSARIRQSAVSNSEILQTVDSVGDKNSVDVGDDISSATASDVKTQCIEVTDMAKRNTNGGITSAAEAETVDRMIDANVYAVAAEDLEEDQLQSKSDDETMDSSDAMHKSVLGVSTVDTVEQVTAESTSTDENCLLQSEGVFDEKKMEKLDDLQKNVKPGSFDGKNKEEKSDLSPSEEPPLASVDLVDAAVGIVNNASNESKESDNKISTENLRLNLNNGNLDTISASSAEKNLSMNEDNTTNDMQDEVKQGADSDVAKQDRIMGIENQCDKLHEALQQIIPENVGSNEALIIAQKHGGYNLRHKKNDETTIFVSSFGVEENDDTESDDSTPKTRINRNRSNSSSSHHVTRGQRERGASVLSTVTMSADKAACASEKLENPFFKHFSTIDQWFTSVVGKKNHPFRKCICIYCEEYFKDGLIDAEPKSVIKKSRPCRAHLNNCIAYQLYLQKTGKKSVTESSEFGLKKHEIVRLRARLKANVASNNNSSRNLDSASSIIKNRFGGDDVDKERVDELERRIQLRMKEEARNVLSLTKRPKTVHHDFYDHFRFFDDSQVHIRQGIPTAKLRGFCIYCEEQYNAGITDRKPDFVTRRARNCRSHLDNCKHYKAFLSSTGLPSVTEETLVGLEKSRRDKVVEALKRVGKEPPKVKRGSNRVEEINKEILEREASNGIQHNLLLSPLSDNYRSKLLGSNKNHEKEVESEAKKDLRNVFEQIIPLAEGDPELCLIAMQQMNDTLLTLRNTIANKKRKLAEVLVSMKIDNSSTAAATTTTGTGTAGSNSRKKSTSRKKPKK